MNKRIDEESRMQEFAEMYDLLQKTKKDAELQLLLEFCSFFKKDDIGLFDEYAEIYEKIKSNNNHTGKAKEIVRLYKEKLGITSDDDKRLLKEIIDVIGNNGLAFHLTADIDAEDIIQTGLDPNSKQEMIEEIKQISGMLSEKTRGRLFPIARLNTKTYSYSTNPRLNVSYGRCPEWLLNLTDYAYLSNVPIEEVLANIEQICIKNGESEDAIKQLLDFTKKNYNLYLNAKRKIIVFPSPMEFEEEMYEDVNAEVAAIEIISILQIRTNEKCDRRIPPEQIVVIDESTKEIDSRGNEEKCITIEEIGKRTLEVAVTDKSKISQIIGEELEENLTIEPDKSPK